MKSFKVLFIILVFICAGCSSVKVIPEQVASGVINQQDNSQTISKDRIAITVLPVDMDMVNYNIESIVASFQVEIQNNTNDEISFTKDSFVLVDSNSRQYYPLTPEKIREMMAKDTYYLLPYPYVGFYYLEDYEQAQFKNSTSSNLPYYFEIRPQELYTKALNFEPIIPMASIKGLLYFNTDIRALSSFTIKIFKAGTSKSSVPDFIFPYKVIK